MKNKVTRVANILPCRFIKIIKFDEVGKERYKALLAPVEYRDRQKHLLRIPKIHLIIDHPFITLLGRYTQF